MIRELIADFLLIWWGLWTCFVFTWIIIYGKMVAVEPNHWILIIEYILTIAGTGLAFERLWDDLKKLRRK